MGVTATAINTSLGVFRYHFVDKKKSNSAISIQFIGNLSTRRAEAIAPRGTWSTCARLFSVAVIANHINCYVHSQTRVYGELADSHTRVARPSWQCAVASKEARMRNRNREGNTLKLSISYSATSVVGHLSAGRRCFGTDARRAE